MQGRSVHLHPAVVLLALGFHRDAPPPVVTRPWSLLVATILALLASASLQPLLHVACRPEAAAVLLAAVVVVVAGRRGSTAGGLAVLAGAVAVAGLVELGVVIANGDARPVLTSALALVATLVAVPAARRRERATSPTPG